MLGEDACPTMIRESTTMTMNANYAICAKVAVFFFYLYICRWRLLSLEMRCAFNINTPVLLSVVFFVLRGEYIVRTELDGWPPICSTLEGDRPPELRTVFGE